MDMDAGEMAGERKKKSNDGQRRRTNQNRESHNRMLRTSGEWVNGMWFRDRNRNPIQLSSVNVYPRGCGEIWFYDDFCLFVIGFVTRTGGAWVSFKRLIRDGAIESGWWNVMVYISLTLTMKIKENGYNCCLTRDDQFYEVVNLRFFETSLCSTYIFNVGGNGNCMHFDRIFSFLLLFYGLLKNASNI